MAAVTAESNFILDARLAAYEKEILEDSFVFHLVCDQTIQAMES